MDRVGNWLKRNPHLFCSHGHDHGHGHGHGLGLGHGHGHVDNDEYQQALKQKKLDKFWLEAEKMIQKRQRIFLLRQCDSIRHYLQPKNKNYNQKITFIDKKIEQDI